MASVKERGEQGPRFFRAVSEGGRNNNKHGRHEKSSFLDMAAFIIGDHMEDKDFIDVSNMTTQEYLEYMHELDQRSLCPCIGCEKCQIRMQRHECKEYQDWVRRYVTG